MRITISILAASLLLLVACAPRSDDASLVSTGQRVFGTIEAHAAKAKIEDSAALVALGKHLYFSNELSVNRTQSCNSCHPVDGGRAGVDRLPTSPGAKGDKGRRNTPTVFNSAWHVAQFWDGRAATLEEQASGPVLNPVEMAMPDEKLVTERLRSSSSIDQALFRAAFPTERDPFTLPNAARAIAAFERTLVTRDRVDEFLSGNLAALTAHEKEGMRRFMALGCTSCHNGPLVGARLYQRIGIVNPWPDASDKGRAEVTKNRLDEYVFKVPSLRNVALTPPYFHDGSVADLPTAVDRMAFHQLGTKLETKDRDAIVAFLRALSDKKLANGV